MNGKETASDSQLSQGISTFNLEMLNPEASVTENDCYVEKVGGDNLYKDLLGVKDPVPHKSARRPNYFVSLPINNEMLKDNLSQIQVMMIERDPRLEQLRVPPATFHLTLMVMHLDYKDEKQMERAKQALDKSRQEMKPHMSSIDHKLSVAGIGHFDSSVVFAKISQSEEIAIQTASDRLRLVFDTFDIPSADDRPCNPHITLFKTIKSKPSKRGSDRQLKKIPALAYAEFKNNTFGVELLSVIQLCAMDQPKQKNGYYHVLHQLPLQDPPPVTTDEEKPSST